MISKYIDKIKVGRSLQSDEAEQCLNIILEKDVMDGQIAELLIALSEKSESADEILGFARALLARSRHVPLPSNAIDSCGTGGSGLNRFNVSTTAAFVLSAGGVPVIKHGNKGSKRPNGSFDLLEKLGCEFDFEDDRLADIFARTNVCFLFAHTYHPVMKKKGIIYNSDGFLLTGICMFDRIVPYQRKEILAKKAPGKHYRDGITLAELFQHFPDDKTAEKWFVECRWEHGVQCAYCDSENVNEHASHATMPYRCRDCGKRFSVKTNSVMHASNLGYQKWAIAIYLITTSLKGVSSMKLHRDLGITQKSAWHMLHRIRKAWETTNDVFDGEVEADETYIGGKEGNKHASKKLHAGRGTVGKTAVAGVKDRNTNQISAKVVESTDRPTLQEFVVENTTQEATIYTDEARAYNGLPRKHSKVKHSVGEYVREQVHTNGIESFWSMLKRGYMGIYHHMSPKHLYRYVVEFRLRHNRRPMDTIDQMAAIVKRAAGRRLPYQELIAG